MTWREASMREAVAFIAGRTVDEDAPPLRKPDTDAEVERFTDGTAVACASDYSAYASGSWADPPKWWVYE